MLWSRRVYLLPNRFVTFRQGRDAEEGITAREETRQLLINDGTREVEIKELAA